MTHPQIHHTPTGKAIAEAIRGEIKVEVDALKAKTSVTPGLAVVLVGNRTDSATYVRMKIKACEEVRLCWCGVAWWVAGISTGGCASGRTHAHRQGGGGACLPFPHSPRPPFCSPPPPCVCLSRWASRRSRRSSGRTCPRRSSSPRCRSSTTTPPCTVRAALDGLPCPRP